MTTLPAVELVAGAVVHAGPQLPPLPGFLRSSFAPLVYTATRECLGDPRSEHRLAGVGDRAAIVLCSRRFDTVTLEMSVDQIDRGRVSPILFYQVLPTAVLGQIARDYRLTGPVSCVAVTGDAHAEVLEVARLSLAEEDTDWVLSLTVELDADPAQGSATADLVRSAREPAARKEP